MTYTVEPSVKDDNVVAIRHSVTDDSRFSYLLVSDVHWDSPHCNRQLLKQHFDEAVSRGAGIISVGDWFDAMQGRDDRRHQKGDVRPELGVDDYLDQLVEQSAEWLGPYADHIVFLADGNHETSVRKKLETDLTGRLSRRIGAHRMGYSGFVQFRFEKIAPAGTRGGRITKNMYFHHGSGGGGPVTKGVIQTNRRAVYLPDADLVVSGHIHEWYQVSQPRIRLLTNGRTCTDEQIHLCLGTYKDETDLFGGWHTERSAPPKPLGGTWLTWEYQNTRQPSVKMEVMRAQ